MDEIDESEFELKFEATEIKSQEWWEELEPEERVTLYLRNEDKDILEEELNLEKIREAIGKLAWAINRQSNRSLMPYDWIQFGHPELVKLLDLSKIDIDGSLKYKDKKGSWRVMKK